MEFLRELFGSKPSDKSPPAPAPSVDWTIVQKEMDRFVERGLSTFLREHECTAPYAICIYGHVEYGDFYLGANDETMLAVVAEEYRNDPKGYNEDHSVEELKSMLRWSIPDWGYYGFFHSAAEGELEYAFNVMEKFAELPLSEELAEAHREACESLMRCACKALVHAEATGLFDSFETKPELICIDSDEDMEVAQARMEKTKQQYSADVAPDRPD